MDRRRGVPALGGLGLFVVLAFTTPALAQSQNGAVYVQCPGDSDGTSVPGPAFPNARCMHLAAGDGFVTMADGKPLYIFGFSDITGSLPSQAIDAGALSANFPAPTIRLREGQDFYLNLTNVGMQVRVDLSDPHSVHFHGFPNAAPVFDGTPENSLAINMGSTLTYYYKIVEPGTYMYHCHVEATEHMQMGMLGNLYVEPRQNDTGYTDGTGHHTGTFAYNDGDGSTRYDVEYPIQIGSFDPNFHDASENVQPLPFGVMFDRYGMLNGRGYPDTVNTGVLSTDTSRGLKPSQPVNSLITAHPGQRVLLRISNLNVTRFYTLASTIPMKVVGHSARLYRGPAGPGASGTDLYYTTNSVTLGGGESIDVILEPATAGTHLLYTTNLNYLSNNGQDLGGMMTEIRVE